MATAGPRRRGGSKPTDVGTGVVCASFASGGAWLSLGTVDPRAGFVELTGMPPFDEGGRADPGAVRAYRDLMTDERTAFLVVDALAGTRVRRRTVCARRGEQVISQHVSLVGSGDRASGRLGVRLRFRGRLALPALAMITEVSPPPSQRRRRQLSSEAIGEGRRLRVRAADIGVQAAIDVAAAPGAQGLEWAAIAGDRAVMEVTWPATVTRCWVRIAASLGDAEPVVGHASPQRFPAPGQDRARAGELWVPPELEPLLRRVARRALRYVRECTALRVAPDRVVILTDHRLLPLSWTRDAYWQALLLLQSGEERIVGDHLRWLWLDCQRPDGTWARSHHADGRRKDEVYQADQQLYPLLELLEYRRASGRLPELAGGAGGRSWPDLVAEVLEAVSAQIAPLGLLPTAENAADDPAGLPFLLANQVLAWHTLRRLAEVDELGALSSAAATLSRDIAAAVARHFPLDGPRGKLWAYAVDGHGAALRHHDANDVPTALAPLWGFCAPGDPYWRRTMEFAFSPANGAFVGGRFGGLGSRHTPGVWTLGLIQEWLTRSLMDERDEAADALRRMLACAMTDWSLPEASDAHTGRVIARHWFAWPGAMLGALVRSGSS
jgi:hypothetical protein